MSGLDSRFIITSDLESYFVDKDSGEPLAAGIVTFYSDINRTTLKPVYQLTGSPPNYSYAALPNPCILSAVGTFQDGGGNNIVPYYFPYTGTPADNTGVLELYYITVQSSGNVLQFTREGWPNAAANQNAENTELKNFIPNSQFWFHNNQPPVITAGGLDIYPIAQGGWFLKRTTGGTSNIQIDNSFELITTAVAGLNDYPRYSFTFKCSSFNASDTTRDLAIQWDSVYQFLPANPPGSQQYTLFFAAQSNDSNSYTFDLRLIHNFGTGGTPSAQTDVSLGFVKITPSYSYYTIPITFPVITGTLGTNNDDYVSLQLRGPASSWDVDVTDFALYFGEQTPTFLNVQTVPEMKSEGIAGFMPIPNPDGSDLYLPLLLTPEGLTFSDVDIGKIYASPFPTVQTGELLCDGTAYPVSGYSTDGIPYRRLFSKILGNNNVTFWGGGADYVNAYTYSPPGADLLIMTNKVGSQTNAADGASPTGFSFLYNTPGATTRDFDAQANLSAVVIARCKTVGACTTISAGTSGMSVVDLTNTALTNYQFKVVALDAVTLGNGAGTGLYFDFHNTTTGYRMWFQTATETAPAAGGNTLVKVELDINLLANAVSAVIANTINAYQTDIITCTSGATIPAGSFFTFQANGVTYSPWYKVDGVGSAPASPNPIEIDISASTIVGQVAFDTQTAINSQFFATPNYQGMFLRGIESTSKFDNKNLERGSKNYTLQSTEPNTFEPFFVQSHTHTFSIPNVTLDSNSANTIGAGGGGDTTPPTTISIANFGNNETRPVNVSVNWVIKY